MSRTGLYWTDDRDRLHCSHGLILYGTKCLRCERGDIIDPNLTELGKHVSGFDTASGPDHHVEVTARVNGDGSFTVDDIKTSYEFRDDAINGNRERMEALHERINEALRRSAGGRDYYRMPDPPWDFGKRWEHSGGDPRPRAHAHWHDWPGSPFRQQIEVITDPLDQRGVNARRVGPER